MPAFAGLNLLADIAELNIPGLQGAYGTTEKFLSNNQKEFPQAKSANPKEFLDNSFVENLDRSGFLATIGLGNKSDNPL